MYNMCVVYTLSMFCIQKSCKENKKVDLKQLVADAAAAASAVFFSISKQKGKR